MSGREGGIVWDVKALEEHNLISKSTPCVYSYAGEKDNTKPYLGIDCTGDSLHVGHLLPIMEMFKYIKKGHDVVFVLGGATTRVGDPTGKNKARDKIDKDTILKNTRAIKCQLIKLIGNQFGENGLAITGERWSSGIKKSGLCRGDIEYIDEMGFWEEKIEFFADNVIGEIIVENNVNWYWPGDDQGFGFNYIDFIREHGSHFSVNEMLKLDSVKLRLDQQEHMSVTELNYMIMQAYDFYYLNKEYGVNMQIGGQDQWGNIAQGISFCRKKGVEVHGITTPLLTTKNGNKMGKTEGGAIWLDGKKTSPFYYWQFFRNVCDVDVQKWFGWFTFEDYPREEGDINQIKIKLATLATSFVHGCDVARECEEEARTKFGDGK